MMANQCFVLLLLTIVGGNVRARGFHEEPSCSKFAFEEKVLEKLVRNEHKIEIFESKLNQWEERIGKMLTQLKKGEQQMVKDTSTMQKELRDEKSNLENAMTALGKQQERMSQDLFDKQREINDTLLKSAINLKESLTTPAIAFKVRHVSDTSPSGGDHVIYTVPVVNVGGGYDTNTGEFTVPRDGLYMFTVQMCTSGSKLLQLQIMAANQIIEALRYYEDAYSGTCTSGSGVAVLSTGDKVWVKCYSASSGTVVTQGSDYSWNSFSGILLN